MYKPLNPPLRPCRYLGGADCAYWDMELRGDEDIKCHPGGWECYEEPGGIAYIGHWVSIYELLEHAASAPVSEYTWPECEKEMQKLYWIDLLKATQSQIVDPPKGG